MVEGIQRSPTARAGVLALAYFAGAELGHVLSLQTLDQSFATFWPPAGLLLASLVLTPGRLWPLMLSAACSANLASDVLLHGKSVLVSLGFFVANGGEACIGAWLLCRFVGLPFTMARLKDVMGLACWSALISTAFGALIGAGMVKMAFPDTAYWSTWKVWWIADAAGILVFAPMVFAWTAEWPTEVPQGWWSPG
jgi:integral membrane sensor domain MASE1